MTAERGFRFVFDERLGIRLPETDRDWWLYSLDEQAEMIEEWERIKSRIPDRIKELEDDINAKHLEISEEDDWDRVCELYEQYFAIASVINDLNIWAKIEPGLTDKPPVEGEEDGYGIADEHTNREKE